MTRKNYRLLISALVLAIITAFSVTIANANTSNLLAVATNKKPVLRNTQSSSQSKTQSLIDLKGSTIISRNNPRITLSLNKSDVQPVLRMFADKAGLNVVFHDSAKGQVTLDMVNVPLNDAFRMVLQVAGLTYHLDGKTMIVSSQDFARSVGWSKQEMAIVPVNYVDAAVVANFLNQNIFCYVIQML